MPDHTDPGSTANRPWDAAVPAQTCGADAANGDGVLVLLLMAAVHGRRSIQDVEDWLRRPGDEPVRLLLGSGAHAPASELQRGLAVPDLAATAHREALARLHTADGAVCATTCPCVRPEFVVPVRGSGGHTYLTRSDVPSGVRAAGAVLRIALGWSAGWAFMGALLLAAGLIPGAGQQLVPLLYGAVVGAITAVVFAINLLRRGTPVVDSLRQAAPALGAVLALACIALIVLSPVHGLIAVGPVAALTASWWLIRRLGSPRWRAAVASSGAVERVEQDESMRARARRAIALPA